MQYTIRKIPLCDPLQFVLYWLIEEGEDNQTHVLVSCMIESKFPLFSSTVVVDSWCNVDCIVHPKGSIRSVYTLDASDCREREKK